ncbi:MAG: Succinyl-CoA ligase [ADP-forming] subunit beta [Candidatus Heimdallarchaeota archaeon LC_3]|nr:MAG: Succinyl-CoA ligase [ADP-forming] subunit beta [Candidatus Heimdallarchaeota archaeon LC_3]
MKLYENEAKKLFSKFNVPIPKQIAVIKSIEELEVLDLKYPIILKVLVLSGGRGKVGGIKKAYNLEEAIKNSKELFQLSIQGYKVKKILIEEAIQILDELYVSILTDPATFDVTILASSIGGVDVETKAKTSPEQFFKYKILKNDKELNKEDSNRVFKFFENNLQKYENSTLIAQNIAITIKNLFSCFQNIDARVCEINPLIISNDENKSILAVDAKIILDDNALYRQSAILSYLGQDPTKKRHDVSEQTKFEARASENEIPYIDLINQVSAEAKDADTLYVGLVPGGAGYGIFSIDEVVNVSKKYFPNQTIIPINFMDSGGGPTLQKVAEMFHLLMDGISDIIITSRFGGISSCDIFIQGLILSIKERYSLKKRVIPVYGRMVGTDLPSAIVFYEKAKQESPKALKNLHIIVGNQKIMADIIKDGLEYGLNQKKLLA